MCFNLSYGFLALLFWLLLFFSYSWAYARTLQENQDYDFMIFASDFSLHFYIHLEICRSALQSSEFLQYRNLVFIGSLYPEGLLTSGKDDRLMQEVMISPWPAKQSIQVQMSVGYPCETLKGGELKEVPPVVSKPLICLFLQTLPGALRLFVNGEVGESSLWTVTVGANLGVLGWLRLWKV